jgi:hypothetical protein
MKEVTRMKTTNATWSADIVRSDRAFELLIVDEESGRTIVREPVDPDDISSVTKALKAAFHSFGAPAELRTDRGVLFAGAAVGDLLRTFGVCHTFAVGGTMAEKRA